MTSNGPRQRRKFDFNSIREKLFTDKKNHLSEQNWILSSQQDPDLFYDELKDFAGSVLKSRFKSIINESYDPYFDLLGCHNNQSSVCYVDYSKPLSPKEYSYKEIAEKVNSLITAMNDSDKDCSRVAIVSNNNFEITLAFLACIKAGYLFTIIAPKGDSYCLDRLASFEPSLVLSNSGLADKFSDYSFLDVNISSSKKGFYLSAKQSHVYESGDIIAELYSSFQGDKDSRILLSIDEFYKGVLRDAFCCFAFSPGTKVSYPGSEILKCHPWFISVCLVSEAVYYDFSVEDLKNYKELHSKISVDQVGFSEEFQEYLKQRPAEFVSKAKFWFLELSSKIDFASLVSIIEIHKLQKLKNRHFLADAARGGALLFSATYYSNLNLKVFPRPASSYELTEVNLSGKSDNNRGGFFIIPELSDQASDFGKSLVSKLEDQMFFVGCNEFLKEGLKMPSTEISNLIKQDSSIEEFLICPRQSSFINSCDYAGLLFFKPAHYDNFISEKSKNIRKLKAIISLNYGEKFIPDKFEYYPYLPRKTEEMETDFSWLKSQHENGDLHKKLSFDVFRNISQLRLLTQRGN